MDGLAAGQRRHGPRHPQPEPVAAKYLRQGDPVSESPPIASFRPDAERRQPGWAGALRGVWLLTWRSQLTLRKLPGQLATLLVLPVLVYITMVSQAAWGERHFSPGNAFQEANSFSRRARSAEIPLQPKTI